MKRIAAFFLFWRQVKKSVERVPPSCASVPVTGSTRPDYRLPVNNSRSLSRMWHPAGCGSQKASRKTSPDTNDMFKEEMLLFWNKWLLKTRMNQNNRFSSESRNDQVTCPLVKFLLRVPHGSEPKSSEAGKSQIISSTEICMWMFLRTLDHWAEWNISSVVCVKFNNGNSICTFVLQTAWRQKVENLLGLMGGIPR